MSTYNKEKIGRASNIKEDPIDDIQEREEEDYEDEQPNKLTIGEFDATCKEGFKEIMKF